jgi:hypothetical protein
MTTTDDWKERRSASRTLTKIKRCDAPKAEAQDITNLVFQFERIMEDEEAYTTFKQYLVESQSTDMANFLEAMNIFEIITDANVKRRKALDIYRQFIMKGAFEEINISSAILKPIQEYFEAYRASISFGDAPKLNVNIFNDAKLQVLHTLKTHSFPVFRRHTLFVEFIKDKDLYYLEKLASPTVSVVSVQSRKRRVPNTQSNNVKVSNIIPCKYTLDPTGAPEVTDRDILFALTSAETIPEDEVNFQKIKSQQDHNCYISKKNIDLGHKDSKEMMLVMHCGTLNYPIMNVMNTVLDTNIMYSKGSVTPVTAITHDPRKSESYSVSVTRNCSSFSMIGLAKKDYCVANSCVFDPHRHKFIMVSRSCTYNDIPEHRGWKRSIIYSAWIFEKVGDNTTRYNQIEFQSMKSWTKRKLFELYYKSQATDFHQQLLSKLIKNSQREFPVPTNTNTVYGTLLDFEQNHLEQSIVLKECAWDILSRALIL